MNPDDSENPRLTHDGGQWVLVLERSLEHPVEDVWAALTEAGQLPAGGPFATDRDLTATGSVRLKHVNYPEEDVKQGEVLEVNAPYLLVFKWGTDVLRWELSAHENKTFLTLRHRFTDRRMAPSYAAGWHLCLMGLSGILAGKKIPSMAGKNAVNYGWQELYDRYADRFGSEPTIEERTRRERKITQIQRKEEFDEQLDED